MADDDFKTIVKTFVDGSEERIRELADEFEAAPGTITRWMHGHSRPAELMVSMVISYIRERGRG